MAAGVRYRPPSYSSARRGGRGARCPPLAGVRPAGWAPGDAPERITESDSPSPSSQRDARIAIGVIAYLAALPCFSLAAGAWAGSCPKHPPTPPTGIRARSEGTSFWDWAFLILVVVVMAPIFEEIFFRGALYEAIRRHAGRGRCTSPSRASSSPPRPPQLPLGFLPILVLGIVFAIVVELRRSLIRISVAHMLNNGVALLLLAVVRTP